MKTFSIARSDVFRPSEAPEARRLLRDMRGANFEVSSELYGAAHRRLKRNEKKKDLKDFKKN